MPAAAVVTLVLTGLLVAALAFYLSWVVLILRGITDTLGKVTFGVRAIAHRTQPITPIVTEMNADLVAVADALEALVATATAAAVEPAQA
ncbi:MAG: hypothetical protein M3387_06070 [Actinomycetota bacterium]|nr:hypothetical protein [Actinomycetota bacterium]